MLVCLLQATQYQGQLYLTTGEYWGYDYIRMPSIYWVSEHGTETRLVSVQCFVSCDLEPQGCSFTRYAEAAAGALATPEQSA
jgi:hypothetical protein